MKARKSTQLVVKPTSPRSPLIKFKKLTGNTTSSGLYVSPYLACTECNTVNFIDATRLSLDVLVKRGDHKDPLHAFIRSFDGEVLPECVGCKRTIHLNVGSVDFTPALVERASSFKQLFDLRQSAAVHIQRICRGRLARKEAQRRRVLKEQRDRLEKWAATTIQRRIRGVISRQTTRIKSGICLIAWTNPILVEKLLNDATRTPLFWFQDVDLMLVMEDYRLYVDRSGPLMTYLSSSLIFFTACLDCDALNRTLYCLSIASTKWNTKWQHVSRPGGGNTFIPRRTSLNPYAVGCKPEIA
ncbi:hypothetical protein AC1031_003956 [Aphanomyces cochlioides]|nr:hypothetical protein AC1031_003956 [Aphanomyces cochlioides]